MKIKYADAINLFGALSALDGYTKIIKASGQDTAVMTAYSFSGPVRIAIARNIRSTAAARDIYQTAYDGLRLQICPGAITRKDVETNLEFVTAANALADETVDIELVTLSWDDLKLDANPIPQTVLASLAILIDMKTGGACEYEQAEAARQNIARERARQEAEAASLEEQRRFDEAVQVAAARLVAEQAG